MRVKENKPQKINSKQNLCGKYEHGDRDKNICRNISMAQPKPNQKAQLNSS